MGKKLFGARLKELREATHMSRQDVADATGLSAHAVYLWEIGERMPGADSFITLCNLFGLPLNELANLLSQSEPDREAE